MLNRNLFKSVLVKKGYTQDTLAEALGISANTLSSRITGKSCFNIDEIDRLCELLDITENSDKVDIFLAIPTQKWDEIAGMKEVIK